MQYDGDNDRDDVQPSAYVGGSDVRMRQVLQTAAQYDPLGFSSGKGCANCQFFVTPDACILVQGVISPTGVSKFWTAIEDDDSEDAVQCEHDGCTDCVSCPTCNPMIDAVASAVAARINEASSTPATVKQALGVLPKPVIPLSAVAMAAAQSIVAVNNAQLAPPKPKDPNGPKGKADTATIDDSTQAQPIPAHVPNMVTVTSGGMTVDVDKNRLVPDVPISATNNKPIAKNASGANGAATKAAATMAARGNGNTTGNKTNSGAAARTGSTKEETAIIPPDSTYAGAADEMLGTGLPKPKEPGDDGSHILDHADTLSDVVAKIMGRGAGNHIAISQHMPGGHGPTSYGVAEAGAIASGVWALSSGARSALPDSAFAYIEPGGKKVDGKTTPDSLRHFPIHDKAHVQAAVRLLGTSPFGSKAASAVHAAAKKYGVGSTASAGTKDWTPSSIVARVKASLGLSDVETTVAETPSFRLFRTQDASGQEQLRFVTTWTNIFEDKSNKILPTFAQKEYVAWADKEQAYPELILWHAVGSKYGQVDWLDFDGAMTHASGTIDDNEWARSVAYRVSETPDVRMSHGSLYREDAAGNILGFRTFELSTLPGERANNPYTTASTIGADAGAGTWEEIMVFTPEKRAQLLSWGMSEEQVIASEKQTEQLVSSLKAHGVAWKEEDAVAPVESGMAMALAELAASVTKGFESLTGMLQETRGVADQALVAANKSHDSIVADSMTGPLARIAAAAQQNGGVVPPGAPVYAATKADDNLVQTLPGPVIGGAGSAVDKQREWAQKFLPTTLGDMWSPVQTGGSR